MSPLRHRLPPLAGALALAFLALATVRLLALGPTDAFRPAIVAVALSALQGGIPAGVLTSWAVIAGYDLSFADPRWSFAVSDPAQRRALVEFAVESSVFATALGMLRSFHRRAARERQAAQAARRRAEESEARFRRLAEDAQDLVYRWRVEPEPGFEYVSPSSTAICGYTPEELYADPGLRTRMVHPEDVAALEAGALDPRAPLLLRWRRKDGTIVWTEQRNVPVHGASGELVAIEGIARDVTAAKAQDDLRALLLSEARRANREREQVLAIVAHDLRNPLASILLNASFLDRADAGGADAAALRSRGEVIRSSCLRMSLLIDDLLDADSIQAGRLRVAPSPQDAGALASEALESLRAVAEKGGVALVLQVDDALPLAEADHGRVVQVLQNLLSNALHATAAGGRVEVQVQRAGPDTLRFRVRDSGSGIAPQDLPHVFERFRRGGAVRYRGSGLGLAIARGIVEAHGGTMEAHSRQGEGSVFSFTLPGSRGEAPPAASAAGWRLPLLPSA